LRNSAFLAQVASCVCSRCSTRLKQHNVDEGVVSAIGYYDKSTQLPKYEEIVKIIDAGVAGPAVEVESMVPYILAASTNSDETVRTYAALALFAISRRNDSATVLSPNLDGIARLFKDPNERLQGAAAMVFSNLRPSPPPEALQYILAAMKDPNTSAYARTVEVHTALRIAPSDTDVAGAVKKLWSTDLDKQGRIDLLNALADPRIVDKDLERIVINALENNDVGIRSTALQVLGRMREHIPIEAVEPLKRLTRDPGQSNVIRELARSLLKRK